MIMTSKSQNKVFFFYCTVSTWSLTKIKRNINRKSEKNKNTNTKGKEKKEPIKTTQFLS